jgi:hypothetical protein
VAKCSGNHFAVIEVEISASSYFKEHYLQTFVFYLPYSSLFNLLTAFSGRRCSRSTATDAAYRPVCARELAASAEWNTVLSSHTVANPTDKICISLAGTFGIMAADGSVRAI